MLLPMLLFRVQLQNSPLIPQQYKSHIIIIIIGHHIAKHACIHGAAARSARAPQKGGLDAPFAPLHPSTAKPGR